MLQKELSSAQAQIRTLQAQLNRLPLAMLNQGNKGGSPRAPAGLAAEGGGAALRYKQREAAQRDAARKAAVAASPRVVRPASPRDELIGGALGIGGAGGGHERSCGLSEDERRQRLSELDPAAAAAITERRGQMDVLRQRLMGAQAQAAAEITLANLTGSPTHARAMMDDD